MNAIKFDAVVGADRTIRFPDGIEVPQGEVEVVVNPRPKLAKPRPGPGLCAGMIEYMAPDFDAPLEDMKEYME